MSKLLPTNLIDIINIATSEAIVPKSSKEIQQERRYRKLSEIEQFLVKCKIKPGKHRVTKRMLYKAYTMYSEKPDSFFNFSACIRNLFNDFKNKNDSLMLNYPPIKILNIVDNYINNIKRK